MVHDMLKVGGGVLFWSLAPWTSRDKLLDGLTRLGMNTLCPPTRSLTHCLRSALGSVFPGHIIKPLKGGGLEVTEVKMLDENYNEFRQVVVAKIDAESERITLKPYSYDWANAIHNEYKLAKGMVGQEAVSTMLSGYLKGRCGTTLRPTGGLYWLPDHELPAWQGLTGMVEKAACRGKSACYILRHQMDVDAVRAIRDAITEEVLGTSKKLHDEVTSGELGERALGHRQEEAEALREKIKLFEELLGQGLNSCHEALDNAEQAAAAAVLLAAGAQQEVA